MTGWPVELLRLYNATVATLLLFAVLRLIVLRLRSRTGRGATPLGLASYALLLAYVAIGQSQRVGTPLTWRALFLCVAVTVGACAVASSLRLRSFSEVYRVGKYRRSRHHR